MTLESHSKQKPPYPMGLVQWARQDLNLQPTDYESAALTELSYGPAQPDCRAVG